MPAGRHPVEVAAQRVDFAVMGDHAERVRQIPGGEGVGRESLMHQRQSRHHPFVIEVPIIDTHLIGQQHAFVDQGARRKGRDVKGLAAIQLVFANAVVNLLADHEEFALEAVLIAAIGSTPNKDLANARLDDLDRLTQPLIDYGYIPPTQQVLSFGQNEILDGLFTGGTQLGVSGEKDHADAIFPLGRKLDAARRAFRPQKCVG